jgi:hypothetical protein
MVRKRWSAMCSWYEVSLFWWADEKIGVGCGRSGPFWVPAGVQVPGLNEPSDRVTTTAGGRRG